MYIHTSYICFRKVFSVVVEPPAGWLGGAVNAVLRPELLRGTTQAIQPAHRPPAHLTIEIFPIDSRLRLAEDDHSLLRHGLLIGRAPRETTTTKPLPSSGYATAHVKPHTPHVTRHAPRATSRTPHVTRLRAFHRETSSDFLLSYTYAFLRSRRIYQS